MVAPAKIATSKALDDITFIFVFTMIASKKGVSEG
jgi:hypothetical protein